MTPWSQILVALVSFVILFDTTWAVSIARCVECCEESHRGKKLENCIGVCLDRDIDCTKKECDLAREWLEQETCPFETTATEAATAKGTVVEGTTGAPTNEDNSEPNPDVPQDPDTVETPDDRNVENNGQIPGITPYIGAAAGGSLLAFFVVGGFLWNRKKKKKNPESNSEIKADIETGNEEVEDYPSPPDVPKAGNGPTGVDISGDSSPVAPPPVASTEDDYHTQESIDLDQELQAYTPQEPSGEQSQTNGGGRALSGMFQMNTLQQQLDQQMLAAGGDEGAFFDMTDPERFNDEMRQYGRSPSIGARVANKFASFKRSLSMNFKDTSTLPPKPTSRQRGHTGGTAGDSSTRSLDEVVVRKELRRFYGKHDPSKKSREIDILVDWVMADPKNYTTLRRKLKRKYRDTIRKLVK